MNGHRTGYPVKTIANVPPDRFTTTSKPPDLN